MREYKLYHFDERDHIRSSIDLECEDDAQAIRLAEASPSASMELWQGARKVKRFRAAETRRATG